MLVHQSIYAEVLSRVEAITEKITIGDPFDRNTLMGPVINESAVSRILAQISAAQGDGSRLLVGGDRAGVAGFEGGYFLQPTVFADVDPRSEIAQTEVFGPVLCIIPFTDEDEAIAIANSTQFGLSSYIQTKDLLRAHRVAERLVAGGTMINGAPNLMAYRPFGGLGLSGFGKEGGAEGLAEFQRTKTIAIQA
jgi:aldehyde dehydrogenase (NAD+)